MKTMSTEIFGKWILAGEHAVLRGSPALVFPVFSKSLKLSYTDTGRPLAAEFSGEHGQEIGLLFWNVWEKALSSAGHADAQVSGQFVVQNSIPVGAGMGASASICVALSKWFVWRDWLKETDVYEFARQLENLFHGESSGVDIAVALSGKGLYFERHGERRALVPRWTPQWYLSYSGRRGITEDCVRRVQQFVAKSPNLAQEVDGQMKRSVIQAEEALSSPPSGESFLHLAAAIDQAGLCFEKWGLTDGSMGEHLAMLRQHGAFAVKPTGSGIGGFALSLWKENPPSELLPNLISLV